MCEVSCPHYVCGSEDMKLSALHPLRLDCNRFWPLPGVTCGRSLAIKTRCSPHGLQRPVTGGATTWQPGSDARQYASTLLSTCGAAGSRVKTRNTQGFFLSMFVHSGPDRHGHTWTSPLSRKIVPHTGCVKTIT